MFSKCPHSPIKQSQPKGGADYDKELGPRAVPVDAELEARKQARRATENDADLLAMLTSQDDDEEAVAEQAVAEEQAGRCHHEDPLALTRREGPATTRA